MESRRSNTGLVAATGQHRRPAPARPAGQTNRRRFAAERIDGADVSGAHVCQA